jgi:hypothetical protein
LEKIMAIGRAEKRGNLVFVHDDEGQLRFVRIGELHAQTGTKVSIERAGVVTTFDESGREIEQAQVIGNDVAPPRAVLRQAVGAR